MWVPWSWAATQGRPYRIDEVIAPPYYCSVAVILRVCHSEAAGRRISCTVLRSARFFASAVLRLTMTSIIFTAVNYESMPPWPRLSLTRSRQFSALMPPHDCETGLHVCCAVIFHASSSGG